MKVLVTGKNGQLGSEIQQISHHYPSLNCVFTASSDLNICDKAALRQFIESHGIEAIINCAAYTAVDKAEDEVLQAEAVNVDAVRNIDELAGEYALKYIHISTDYVFDGTKNTPYEEHDPVNPIGVYGKSKRAGEEIVLASVNDAIIIRTSWVYSSFGANFLKTMLRLGAERPELNVVFDQSGTPTYAADLAYACLEILSKQERLSSQSRLYHFSNEGVCSWYDFAYQIMRVSGLDCQVNPIESKDYPTKAQRPSYSVLNKKLIKQHFGLSIPHWTSSLERCIQTIQNA